MTRFHRILRLFLIGWTYLGVLMLWGNVLICLEDRPTGWGVAWWTAVALAGTWLAHYFIQGLRRPK